MSSGGRIISDSPAVRLQCLRSVWSSHGSAAGCKPRASDANFDDLLSGQGFSGAKDRKGPRTIAEMRKEELAKEMDPEKIKARNSKH